VRRAAVLLATGFGIGYLPIAPATWASAVVALLLAGIAPRLGAGPLLALAALVTIAAVPISGIAERTLGHDAHPIVIDEVAGMLVSVAWVPGIRGELGGAREAVLLAAAFALFRFFDIVKPPPVHQSQRLPGGLGVVTDDVLAGLYTNLVLHAIAGLWPA
jgi:phosphatidylglycerophosphatase A